MTFSNAARLAVALSALCALPAHAAGLDGSALGLGWAIPFAGILLCIALCPLFAAEFWHHHFGKVSVFWALCCAVPLCVLVDFATGYHAIVHVLLADYVPFIIFVGALFVVAGGIHIKGSFVGKPVVNVCFLALGAVIANFMGTTGAAMLLIRPLIEANRGRKRVIQTFVFFIFLVANVGGCLTPLGDPPLFLGFLKGVDFFWTASHLIVPWIFTLVILLAIYFVIDSIQYKKDVADGYKPADSNQKFAIEGGINILLLACIIGSVLMSGFWHPGVEFEFQGVHFALESICRDALFLIIAGASLVLTTKATREANHFSWDPILEVAKLFFGIFCCIVPVLEMLRAGHNGAFAPLVALVTNADGSFNNTVFFWLTGSLSAFLDNAPTYLAFFNLAGGDPSVLMTTDARTLMAISMGAVFCGAISYIGNAPNFMTVSICNERGVKMPSFFGYIVWSVCILVPVFFIMDMVFLA
ncbi:sodium:proton antiporter [Sutterella sp.]|uniref:sodium:proton antiporter n=1 Tax=Sutterella sp. TaxID=1981025 RepID=UPI0026E0897F|nr:sodium:proton antiporter [Sutterella sp.]MDO5531109.1 sodium:proton antiporter [Sutterella sp.]